MKLLLSHKVIVAFFVLFAFVISTNALLYGVHSVHEFNHGMSSGTDCAVDVLHCLKSVTAGHHDSGHEDPCQDCEPNGENHSHALIACATFSITPILLISAPDYFELFQSPPEVYLDRFIPPQNLS